MKKIVVDLLDRRPAWAIPEWALSEMRESLPEDWALEVATSFTDGSGDGATEVPGEVLGLVEGAHAYVGYGVRPEILSAGGDSLEWVHTATAGVGGSLHRAMRESRVRFTNSAGIHGPPIAETVVGMLLYFARGLDFARAAQAGGRWDTGPFLHAETPVRELASMTVGILGYGGIGREVGDRLRALGAGVLGLRRSPPDGSGVEVAGDAGGRLEVVHGADGLDRLLRESDALVVAAPETPETRGILDRARIRALRPGAILVNVARGSLVDQAAVAEALRDGHLRGAGLDVFEVEPLPADDPLWALPNALITPHVSGVSSGFWRRELDLLLENVDRLDRGAPLKNEVDRGAGY